MKTIKAIKFTALIALVLSIAVGCASTPSQDQTNAQQAIAQAKAAVSDAQAGGYITDDALNFLKAAEDAASAGDNAKAINLANQTINNLKASKAIMDAENAAAKANSAGAEWRDTGKLIDKAKAAMKAGDYAKAIQLADQARMQAEEAMKQKAEQDARVAKMFGEKQMGTAGGYTVVRGDSLWAISGKSDIYGNPYEWPLIYKANRDKIKDADLIYPGQQLSIERNASQADIDAAVNHAKTRGAWALGKVEASDKAYLAQ